MRRLFVVSGNYNVNPDGTVDVQGICRLKTPMPRLPVQFKRVTGQLVLDKMQLETLEGCPEECGELYCSNNPIRTLHGAPKTVQKLNAFNCKLTNLEGCPESVGKLDVTYNLMENFQGISEGVGELHFGVWNSTKFNAMTPPQEKYVPIAVLYSLQARRIHVSPPGGGYSHLQRVEPLNTILNKHAGQGPGGILTCASELTEAGWDDWANL